MSLAMSELNLCVLVSRRLTVTGNHIPEWNFGCGGREGVNLGCPIRRVLEAAGDFSLLLRSSVEDPWSSDDITIY